MVVQISIFGKISWSRKRGLHTVFGWFSIFSSGISVFVKSNSLTLILMSIAVDVHV